MNSITPTPVRVRAQANGGKYLGPDAYAAPVLSVLVDGRQLIPPVTIPNNSSGVVVATKDGTSSSYSIVVQPATVKTPWYPPVGTFYLDPPSPDPDDASVVVLLPLSSTTEVEFRIEAFAPQPVSGSVTLAITPGRDYLSEPGVVVPVPGLLCPSLTVTPSGPGSLSLTATVKMMCGCPIIAIPADGPPPDTEYYWPSSEFAVIVTFIRVGAFGVEAPSGAPQPPPSVVLTCTATDTFTATATIPAGSYRVLLSASQESTGNAGSASTDVVVE